MNKNKLVIALGLTSSLGLVGCGDGETGTTANSNAYSVTAIDGYLKNAQVWLDVDGDFQLDPDEPSAISGDGGKAVLDVSNTPNPENYAVIVKAIKGQTIDETTGPVLSDYVMSAPAGQTDVTPLSTLVHVKLESGTFSTIEEAVTDVANDLGLEESDVLGDYIEDGKTDAAYSAEALVTSGVIPEDTTELSENADGSKTDLSDNSEQIGTIIKAPDFDPDKTAIIPGDNGGYESVENTDTDGDGVIDELDEFVDDDTEWVDSDKDGTGDNADTNDDNDAALDVDDDFPFDKDETTDTDGDGIGNNADLDDDNDDTPDVSDDFPLDENETTDTDGDGVGNNADLDDDNDDTPDASDDFPLDKDEATDTDGDGIGNNEDTDDDNDGILDEDDDSPLTPDLSPIQQVITFMRDSGTFYSLWADEETRNNNGVETTDVEVFVEEFTLNNDIGTLSKLYQVGADGRTHTIDPNDDKDIILGPQGWEMFNDVYSLAIVGDAISVYPADLPTLTSTASGYVRDLSGKSIAGNAGELSDYVNETAVFPQGSQGGSVSLTADFDEYYLWNKPWFYHGTANNEEDGNNATSFADVIVNTAAGDGALVSTVKGLSIGYDIGIELVTGGVINYYTWDWSWTNGQETMVTLNGSGQWTQSTVNGEEVIRFDIPQSVIDLWGDAWDHDTNQRILSAYDGYLYEGEFIAAGDAEDDNDGYLLNAVAKEALINAINIEGWCFITETDSGSTLADFEAQLADCTLPTMMPEDSISYRVSGSGETRSAAYGDNSQMLRFKNSAPSMKYWNMNSKGILEIGENANEIWDYRKLIIDVNDDKQYSVAHFDPEEGSIWLATYLDVDINKDIQTCDVDESGWNDETDQPINFKTYAQYIAALDSCREDEDYKTPLFSTRFIGDERVLQAEDERLSFMADGSGKFEDLNPDGTVMESFNFTWAMHDVDKGIIKLSFAYTDDNNVAQTATDYMTIAYSNGIEFNVKVFTVSSEWGGNAITEEGEIWYSNYSNPDSESELTDLGFITPATP
ncbi:hypothetical protein [Vibrio cortegadensis]|uniref:Uncharacterized protein n=1 Tax=Vibrio cortegadensis TaxID=1328770 RepID=A0ABV4M4A0_9VIBR